MKVDLITETNSDLTVVNAAKCSFDKESKFVKQHNKGRCNHNSRGWHICNDESHHHNELCAADCKLIAYLANHNHWTPFSHPQEVFELRLPWQDITKFLLRANLAGFEWHKPDMISFSDNVDRLWAIRGSLYAWLTNTHLLPADIAMAIQTILDREYPVSTKAILGDIKHRGTSSYIEHINQYSLITSMPDELRYYTLRIHCPIFVKRQLETHRRNLVMTDIEDLSQNEVSRRYVDSEPEIYEPSEWKLQSKSVKQGSTDKVLSGVDKILADSNYAHHTYNAKLYYNKFNELSIAHELSRMILPQSTYTTFWWTGSVKSFKRVINLRTHPHAQYETRVIAEMIQETIKL